MKIKQLVAVLSLLAISLLLLLVLINSDEVKGKVNMTKEVIFHTKNGQYKIDIFNPSEKDKENTGMKIEDFERMIEEVEISLEERVKKLEIKVGN